MKWYFVACIFLLVSKSVQSKSSQQILDEVKEIAKKSCTAENAEENKFYFPHPEKEKFIQCDEWGNYHVMQCAPGTAWSQKVYTCDRENSTPTTTKSTSTNPCTKENIDAGRFYFAYSNENFFIYCNKWGAYCVMPCAPGTKWLQVIESCVADDSNVKTTTTTKYDITNPCTKENIDAGIFYQPHPNRNYFIQCDQWGNYHEMPCAPGTQWSQSAYTCIFTNQADDE